MQHAGKQKLLNLSTFTTIMDRGPTAPSALALAGVQIFLIALVLLPPKHYVRKEAKRFRSAEGADVMAFLGGWKTADKPHWRLRQQEALVGGIATLLLAVATVAVTYLYY
jgi:hypothetical protein